MTEENRRQAVADELAKARRWLAQADRICEDAAFDLAVSVAYYYVFYLARALLLMEGLEARSHSSLVHLVSQHFVRTGRLGPETAAILSQLYASRQLADYETAAVFTEAMARKSLQEARRYGEEVEAILRVGGYL